MTRTLALIGLALILLGLFNLSMKKPDWRSEQESVITDSPETFREQNIP